MPRKMVKGGASNNPACLKASPNAKIPEPTLPLNRCIMVSIYLRRFNLFFSFNNNLNNYDSATVDYFNDYK